MAADEKHRPLLRGLSGNSLRLDSSVLASFARIGHVMKIEERSYR
jgi:hypothetical protein